MQVIEVSTDHATIRVVPVNRNENREWLHRHALHQLIKAYRRDYGAQAVESLMNELNAYHSARTVGMR
jgi:uncharacterized protein YllA (UPF0747 family)